MPQTKCAHPNCQNKVEYVVTNRTKNYDRMIDEVPVCKEHYDLLQFIDYVRIRRD